MVRDWLMKIDRLYQRRTRWDGFKQKEGKTHSTFQDRRVFKTEEEAVFWRTYNTMDYALELTE